MTGIASKLPNAFAASELAQRHQSSGLNSAFRGKGLTFAAYVSASQEMLFRAHTKLATPDIETVIAGNAPFVIQAPVQDGVDKPYRRGILLTHGLTDSPYFMRHLADFFHQQGFLVLAILLPGHGTQPGDLLDVTWHEWAHAVTYGTECLAQEVEEVYLGGLSTGATLSLHQSINDARVRALFLFSPALKITPRAAFANLHKLYSRLVPRAKWITIQPDIDTYKYESFAKNGAAQMYRLTRVVQARLASLRIPVFAVASIEDTTVRTPATLDFMLGARHPSSKLVLYGSKQTKLPKDIPEHRLEWVNSMFPDQHIISSSHLAIVLAAHDAHYGCAGTYSNCAHYYPHDPEKYFACRNESSHLSLGEITPENLCTGVIKRLMFNPNFEKMKISMQQFISRLPAR